MKQNKTSISSDHIIDVINSLKPYNNEIQKILDANNIKNIKPNTKIPSINWLEAFKDIADTIGSKGLCKPIKRHKSLHYK
jgi:hypothetical protein